jgi:hypothetical protein
VATTADQIDKEHVRALPEADRLELISLIASELAAARNGTPERPEYHLTDLEGIGKGLWEGIDAQEYVNKLRDEWDERTP